MKNEKIRTFRTNTCTINGQQGEKSTSFFLKKRNGRFTTADGGFFPPRIPQTAREKSNQLFLPELPDVDFFAAVEDFDELEDFEELEDDFDEDDDREDDPLEELFVEAFAVSFFTGGRLFQVS